MVTLVASWTLKVLLHRARHHQFSSGSPTFFLSLPSLLVEEDELSLLTALLEESESALNCDPEGSHPSAQGDGQPDTFDELFDADGDGESYTEEAEDGEVEGTGGHREHLAALFGDTGDLTDEEEMPAMPSPENRALLPAPSQGKTTQELQGALPTDSLSLLHDR